MIKIFKVVRIIDDTALIVNGGKEDKIEKGDTMLIYSKGETIIDPETKENLGELKILKAKLNVTVIYDKMCICETPYVSSAFSAFASSSLFNATQKKLDVEPTDITGEGDKTIRIGDYAEHIKPDKQPAPAVLPTKEAKTTTPTLPIKKKD